MTRPLSLVAALALLLMLPMAAEADNVACYDWECNQSTHVCTFDSGCTELDGSLWRYVWDFGDGSGSVLTGNEVIQHQYAFPHYTPDVKLTVAPYDVDFFSVECEIVVDWQVGPPQPDPSGTCSE